MQIVEQNCPMWCLVKIKCIIFIITLLFSTIFALNIIIYLYTYIETDRKHRLRQCFTTLYIYIYYILIWYAVNAVKAPVLNY